MIDVRLIAHAPNGASLGPLPSPLSLQAGYVLNDTGALALAYHPEAARSDLLGQPVEVVTEVSTDGGATWAEPRNGRFVYLRDGRDPIKTDDSYAIEAPAYVWRLEKALVGTASLNQDGGREFIDWTPGAILRDLFDEAQARGALAGMTRTWDGNVDTNGTPWPAGQSITYDPGANLLSVLQGMADAGWVDFSTQGRSLELFTAGNPDGLAGDKTVGASPVSLRFGRDLTEAPFRRTWEGLADTALVMGDEGKVVTRINPAAYKPWGVQETYVTASGVTDEGTLAVLGDGALTFTEQARAEHTFGLIFATAPNLPFRDYGPGDWVLAATDGQAPVPMRLRQVTLTRDEKGMVSGNVVLNDRFLEADVLQNRRLQRIIAGATQSGTGGTPGGIGPDILAPHQVEGLGGSSAAYVDADGVVRSQVTLNWNDVTQNADNTPTSDVDGYEVWGRIPGQGDWWQVAYVDDSFWTNSPYEPGVTWEFRVRAVDTSWNKGQFSTYATVTTVSDLVPPPKPSAPTAQTRLGTARITWDGLTATATNMASTVEDFRYVDVHVSQVNNFTPTDATRVGELSAPGYVVAGPLDYQATYYARLVAYDSSGNASTPSDVTTVTVAALVDVSNFPDDAMETLYARTGKFLDLTADNFAANLIEGSWIKAGAIEADRLSIGARGISVLVNSYMEQADAGGIPLNWGRIYGATGVTLAGETASPISGGRSLKVATTVTADPAALIGSNANEFPVVAGQKWFLRATVRAVQATPRSVWVNFHTSTPAATPFGFSGATWHTAPGVEGVGWTAGQTRILEASFTVPASHTRANASIRVLGAAGAIGDTFVVDNMEVWPATTDAQITEVAAGKIKTGVIQATERIVAGSLTGARAELNGVGFQAFNPAGTKMFEVQANSGDTYIGNPASQHVRLGAYANNYSGGAAQGMVRFGAGPNSGWGDALALNTFWVDGGGANWGAFRLSSPYNLNVGNGYLDAAYLDLRARSSDNFSQFYLYADEANFWGSTSIWGAGDGSTVDFRTVNSNGFQFSDFSQLSRLRLIPQLGYFLVRSADSTGAAQQLRLQGTPEVSLSASGSEVYWNVQFAPTFGHFGRNAGLAFYSGQMGATTYNNSNYIPFLASAFNVNSDPRVKSNARPTTGALANVRAMKVYDYQTEGVPSRKAPKAPKTVKAEDPTGDLVDQMIREAAWARGVMADELVAILPDAVHEDEQGRLSVSLYDLLATTMAAVQELATEVDALKPGKPAPKK